MQSAFQRLTLHQLRIFAAVARHRNFTRAAATLRLTQSAVSAQMRELAAILGVPIVEVVGKKVHLTDAGKALAVHASRLEAQVGEIAQEFAALRSGETGAVRVGASTALGTYYLPARIAQFVPAHPRVEISLRIANSSAVVDWLLQNEVDVGFVGSPVYAPALAATPLFEDEVVFACAPAHPLASEGTVTLSRIAAARCLVREPGSATRRIVEERLYERDLRLEMPLEFGGIEAIKQAVVAGLGISWFSLVTVERELAAGSLVRIPVRGMSLRRTFFLVRHRAKHEGPAIRSFCEFAEAWRPAKGG